MQGPDFIFALQSKTHGFWQVDSTGRVINSNAPYFVEYAPDGWYDIAIQNIRNRTLWGTDRSVTIPLNYVKDAAKILKHIFYKLGTEEQVYLVIAQQKLDYTPGVEYGFWYKKCYRGEVDMSTFNHAGLKVTCTTLEDGLPKYLKANLNTTYEIPMNVADAINVKFDGINLRNKVNFNVQAVIDSTEVAVGFEDNKAFGITKVSEEGDSSGIIALGQVPEQFTLTNDDYINGSDNYLLKNENTYPVTITLAGKLKFKCTDDSGTVQLRVFFKGSVAHTDIDIFDQTMTFDQLYDQDFSEVITLAPGEKLFVLGEYDRDGALDTSTIEFQEGSDFNAFFITRRSTTYIKHLRAQYIFEYLVNKMTEGTFAAEISAYFNTWRQIVFTCGNAIRGLDDAVMKISFQTFFQFWDCFDSVGIMERSGKVGFDRKQALINPANPIVLSAPANDTLKVSFDKSYPFSTLKIGYPEIKNDVGVLNGNEEFNCTYEFGVDGVTNSTGILDKVSKIKASCYEQEKIRITTLEKDTTDYKSDNDVFVNYIEDTLQPAAGDDPAHYLLDRSLNASATGLLEPNTVWNIRLSPGRMLLNNGPFFRSCLYQCDAKNISYRSADKNNKMVAGGVTEKATRNVGGLGSIFFYPVVVDGDFIPPGDLNDLIDVDPTRTTTFPFYGEVWETIYTQVSIAPASDKEQSYKLMLTANNDLTKLIDYDG